MLLTQLFQGAGQIYSYIFGDYIFFGDSHSLSLKDRISSIAKERRINVFYAGLSSCLPFQGIYMELRGNCNLLNKMI